MINIVFLVLMSLVAVGALLCTFLALFGDAIFAKADTRLHMVARYVLEVIVEEDSLEKHLRRTAHMVVYKAIKEGDLLDEAWFDQTQQAVQAAVQQEQIRRRCNDY